MKSIARIAAALIAAFLLSSTSLFGQGFPREAFSAPKVNPDNSVSFSVYAPSAEDSSDRVKDTHSVNGDGVSLEAILD